MSKSKPSALHARLQRQHEEWAGRRKDKVNTAIAAFSHAHMSNTKWRKVFETLASPELGLTTCYWKLVVDDYVYPTSIPQTADLLESHLADGAFVPIEYREIEWIEIPSEYQLYSDIPGRQPRIIKQDITKVVEAMKKVGHFPVELNDTGLLIRGYS
jgi:hypothetical protein